ncbi:MAG: hypothetical protein ACI9MR_002831, partial [Myxococcota bacterium]
MRCAPSTQLPDDGSARRRLGQNVQTPGRGPHVRAEQRGRCPTKVDKPRALLGLRLKLAVLAALVGAGACDFGIGSSDGGCARVHQGDYTFPQKRVINGAVAVRLTQQGTDFLTERIKALVLSFFDADASGRAIIPLSTLGVGAFDTSLGPLDAQVRDVILAIDLADLDVAFVSGSSPPRLRVRVVDADIGIVSGTVSGEIDTFLFDGDVACGLGNGPSGRVALLDMDLVLEVATTAEGVLDVRVLPSSVDLQSIELRITTDCTLPECLDGLSPPSTFECFECETVCPAADIGSALVSVFQSVFDNLVDALLDILADELGNLLLDGFLNGKPIAVEGELSLAQLLGPSLAWMRTTQPLGVVARPAGNAFRITGAGPTLGMDIVLDAGVDAAPSHPCIGNIGEPPTWVTGPRPSFDGIIVLPEGGVTYDVGVGISAAIINETIWSLWTSGALCIDVTTADIASITQGSLVVTARTLDLLLPGLTRIASPDAPIRVRVRPGTLGGAADPIRLGIGPSEPPIIMVLQDTLIAVEAQIGDQFVRLVSFRTDLSVGLALDALPEAKLGVRISDVEVGNLRLPDNEIFKDARLDLIAPFAVDLALGFLANEPIELELGLAGLTSGLGIPVEPSIIAIETAGTSQDWLALYVVLRDPAVAMQAVSRSPIYLVEQAPGQMTIFAPQLLAEEALQVRVAGGSWSRWLSGPGPHVVHPARAYLVGSWSVEGRVRRPGTDQEGEVQPVGQFVVAPPALVPAAPPALAHSATQPAQDGGSGCAGSANLDPFVWLVGLLFMVLWRRPRLASLVVALAFGGCAAESAPVQRCETDDQCLDGYLCAPEGRCVAATECHGDAECCPGAACFNSVCRPTAQCDTSRPCEGLGQTCTDGQCTPTTCGPDGLCPGGLGCVAGLCVAGLPCGGTCGSTQGCHVASGRCVAATCPSCGAGTVAAASASSSSASGSASLTCNDAPSACVCVPLAPLARPLPGVDGVLVRTPAGPTVVSYDPAYGDLVATVLSPEGALLSEVALDGVPPGPTVASPDGYRGGVGAPGPNRGGRPAVSQVPGSPVLIDIFYADFDTEGVRYVRWDSGTGSVIAASALPVPARSGRHSCLTHVSGSDGPIPVGLVFAERVPGAGSGQVSRLYRVSAQVSNPQRAEDW